MGGRPILERWPEPGAETRALAAVLLRLIVVLAVSGIVAPSTLGGQEEPEVPFVPTPMEVVHTILEMAGTTSADTVYDLGSGDGRIPIVAARDYGAVGVGVELDSSLVELGRRRAREDGVGDRVRFIRGDLFEVNLESATVLTLYLNSLLNIRLRPTILAQMRPGSKVVSHVFDMGQWPADTVARRLEFGAFLYLWTVPARVEGRWRLLPGSGGGVVVELDQKFQEFRSRDSSRSSGVRVEEGVLEGDSVRFTVSGLEGRDEPLSFSGTVAGDSMSGRTGEGRGWRAARIGEGGGSLERWEPGGSREGSHRGSAAACRSGGSGSGEEPSLPVDIRLSTAVDPLGTCDGETPHHAGVPGSARGLHSLLPAG